MSKNTTNASIEALSSKTDDFVKYHSLVKTFNNEMCGMFHTTFFRDRVVE